MRVPLKVVKMSASAWLAFFVSSGQSLASRSGPGSRAVRSRGVAYFASAVRSDLLSEDINDRRFGLRNERKRGLPWFGGSHRQSSSSSLFQAASMDAVLASSSNGTTTTNDATATLDLPLKTEILADSTDFIKPDLDRRNYRMIKLPNNVQALLVSTLSSNEEEESQAKVEAASVHVQAGHYDDTIPGLAHFHEHMLFLGTEKYPDEDAYENFLSKFGGSSNAWTDAENTNYYFSITSQKGNPDEATPGLAGALDRLSQFFIAPKFETTMVERELRAVDSEYRNGKTNDSWRNYQMMKSMSNQNHPFSNFGCGNYESLTSKGSPVGELKEFWKKYYKSSNLRLAVVGRSSLDALQKTVEETFGQLPHSDDPPRREGKINPEAPIFKLEHAVYDPKQPAFGPEQLGKIVELKPVLETRSLKLKFATPPLEDPLLRKTNPHRVLSHLMGHESPGSLHSVLNDLGLITGLSSGTAIDSSDFSLFSLSLSLTPKGMEQKDQIIEWVFQWIALIKKATLENPELLSKYHDELRQMAATNFKFRESGNPVDFVTSAADTLFDGDVKPSEFLKSGVLCGEYDPQVANAFMDRLRPDNCFVTIINSDLSPTDDVGSGWKTEPLYGATYRETKISPEQIEKWGNPQEIDSRLEIPALNQYISTDFSLRADDDGGSNLSPAELELARIEKPKLLEERPGFRVYHKMDRYWRVPKTYIRLSLVTPENYHSPRSMTLSRIFQRVLDDDLNSFVYDASLAGCNYRVSCVPEGYRVSASGYSEKLPFLWDTLTKRMRSLIEEFKEGKDAHPELYKKFITEKESLSRETKNYRLDTPYEICSYHTRILLDEKAWYLDDYINEMEGPQADSHPLTMEECAAVAEKCLYGRVRGNAICMGNINEDETKRIIEAIDDQFLSSARPLSDAEVPQFKSMMMPTREEAVAIFGPGVANASFPVKYQELAMTSSEENNAVEATLIAGSDFYLGYEGIGIVDLIAHIAYGSAYNQLRTKEQLGYIVSAYSKKTSGGCWGLTVLIQGNSSPEVLEERIEAWLQTFRKELEEMDPDEIAKEAEGIVGQLMEGDTRLSQEVSTVWGDILSSECANERIMDPEFDRMERLADELILTGSEMAVSDVTMNGNPRKSAAELKEKMLSFFDRVYAPNAPERRSLLTRVYSASSKVEYEASVSEPGVLTSSGDIRYLKQFLKTWPVAPYWGLPKDKQNER